MIRVKTADILTICHDRTNNRPSWLNRGWKIIANGYARGTNNCFAGATTIAVGNPKGKEIINASITDCGRSLSFPIVAARQLKDGVYHRRSDILFLPILLRNMSQTRVKNDKKSKYNSAFSHFVAIYQSRQNKEFPILSHIHDNYLIIKLLQWARKHINTAPFNLFKRKQPLKQAKK